MNSLPDPEFDGQKAWLLFLANLCLKGGMYHFDIAPLVHNGTLPKLVPFSYFELHTDSLVCLSCYKKLGSLTMDVENPPRVCSACTKESFRLTNAVLESKKLLGFQNGIRSINYLIEHNLKLRKGTWHKVSQKN